MSLPRDIQIFLAGYPGQPSDPAKRANVEFYRNERPMQPEGLKYDEFMNRYSQDYDELEENHGYIQWLFPIPEQGVNYRAQPLQAHELQTMASDKRIVERIFRSYMLMMAFYGIRVEEGTGRLDVTDDYKVQLRNLSQRAHNLLRITRILKLLALIPDLSHHAAPLILFFTALHSEGHIDLSPGRMHGGSLERWWVNCLRDEGERRKVTRIVKERGGYGENIWGRGAWERWYSESRLSESGGRDPSTS